MSTYAVITLPTKSSDFVEIRKDLLPNQVEAQRWAAEHGEEREKLLCVRSSLLSHIHQRSRRLFATFKPLN